MCVIHRWFSGMRSILFRFKFGKGNTIAIRNSL
jgi:hypothetical protein